MWRSYKVQGPVRTQNYRTPDTGHPHPIDYKVQGPVYTQNYRTSDTGHPHLIVPGSLCLVRLKIHRTPDTGHLLHITLKALHLVKIQKKYRTTDTRHFPGIIPQKLLRLNSQDKGQADAGYHSNHGKKKRDSVHRSSSTSKMTKEQLSKNRYC